MELNDAIVLDLFAGSGALGIEALSRGAKKVYFCDSSIEATNIINKNLEKTKLKEKSKVYKLKFEEALKIIKNENIKFDIIFLDPPYKTNYISKAIEKILEYNLIKDNTLLVLETDEENRVLEEIKNTVLDIYDVRKYGRVSNVKFIRFTFSVKEAVLHEKSGLPNDYALRFLRRRTD